MLSHSVLGVVSGRSLTTSRYRAELEDKTNVEQALIPVNDVSPNLGPVKSDRLTDRTDRTQFMGRVNANSSEDLKP